MKSLQDTIKLNISDSQAKLVGLLSAPILSLSIIFYFFPSIFTDPRFWAEEGTLYYPLALERGVAFLWSTVNGNFQFLENLFVWLSTLVDVSLAPTITTYLALFVMGLVTMQLFSALTDYGVSIFVALLAVSAWTMMSPMPEIMASATNVQWMTAMSVMALGIQKKNSWKFHTKILASFWVVICGISGVPTIMLTPLMLLIAFITRSKIDKLFSALLIACAALNILVVFSANALENRTLIFDLKQSIIPTLNHVVFSSLMGVEWAAKLARSYNLSTGYFLIGIALSTSLFAWLIRSSELPKLSLVLAFGGIYISILQTIFSLGDQTAHLSLLYPAYGARYYASGCMALICLFALLKDKKISTIFLGFIIAHSFPYMYQESLQQSKFPSWSQDIKNCPELCTIHIWPPNWTMQIRK